MKIIGIDLGHCETASSILEITDKGIEIKKLNIDGTDKINTRLVISKDQHEKLTKKYAENEVIYLDNDFIAGLGAMRIGKAPVNPGKGDFEFTYFKRRPAEFSKELMPGANIRYGMLMSCYIYTYVEQLKKYNPVYAKYITGNNITLLVGCPSSQDWCSEENSTIYADLIKAATGITKVIIVPESRAAMFGALHYQGNDPAQRFYVSEGALVFDFGSSTADCTYMCLGKRKFDFSVALGASSIEQNMYLAALKKGLAEEKYKDIRDSFNAGMSSSSVCNGVLRRAKENYYDGYFNGLIPNTVNLLILDSAMEKSIETAVNMDDEFVKQAVEVEKIDIGGAELSWRDHCIAFMTEAKNRVGENYPLNAVILTGGASKMGFIKEECEKIFGKNVKIINETASSSYTVSDGLSYTQYTDIKAGKVEEEKLKKYTTEGVLKYDTTKHSFIRCSDSDQGSKGFYSAIYALKYGIGAELYEKVVRPCAEDAVNEWKKSPDDLSLDDFSKIFDKNVNKSKNKSIIEESSNDVVTKWREAIAEDIKPMIVSDLKDVYYNDKIADGLKLSSADFSSISIINIEGLDIKNIDVVSLGRKIAIGLFSFLLDWIDLLSIFNLGQKVYQNSIAKFKAEVRDKAWREKYASKLLKKMKNSNRSEIINNLVESQEDKTAEYSDLLKEIIAVGYDFALLRRFEKED